MRFTDRDGRVFTTRFATPAEFHGANAGKSPLEYGTARSTMFLGLT